VDTPTSPSSGHYIDGIETIDDEFTKDNKKRPGRYLIIQQREEVISGRVNVTSSLKKARELEGKIGSNKVKPNSQEEEEGREKWLQGHLLQKAGWKDGMPFSWDCEEKVKASTKVFTVAFNSLSTG
jgi:hypothetical protein